MKVSYTSTIILIRTFGARIHFPFSISSYKIGRPIILLLVMDLIQQV